MYGIKFKKICLGLLLLPFAVLAQTSDEIKETDALPAQQQLVRDLIELENQRLTQPLAARRSQNQSSAVSPMAYSGVDLVLKAMYGVDKRILAEVSFRGKPYLYLRGQAWPIGDSQGQSQLRLLSMSSGCIRLAHKEEQFSACVLTHGGQP